MLIRVIKFTLLLSLIGYSEIGMAQTTTLSMEGRREIDAAHCWEFQSVAYTSTSSEVISGNQSARTAPINANFHSIKSPWIINPNGAIQFKHRLSGKEQAAKIKLYVIVYDYTNNQYDTNYSYSSYTAANATQIVTGSFNIKRVGIYKIIFSFTGIPSSTRGILDEISLPGAYYSNPSNACLPQNLSTDTDGDGIMDKHDEYPNDPALAFNNYLNGHNYTTLMFEDLWPGKGDYDFNDLVLDYQVNCLSNAKGQITRAEISIVLRAIGASYKNGFAFQLDKIEPSKVLSVTGQKLSTGLFQLDGNGTESGQTFAVIPVFDDALKTIGFSGAGTGVNIERNGSSIAYDTSTIVVEFSLNNTGITLNDFTLASFNPFIVINQKRGRELHKLNYAPTNLMNQSLFGSEYDNSNISTGTYYKSKNNLPWVIETFSSSPYMLEKKDITSGYSKLIDWVLSSGGSYSDWYINSGASYRNSSALY